MLEEFTAGQGRPGSRGFWGGIRKVRVGEVISELKHIYCTYSKDSRCLGNVTTSHYLMVCQNKSFVGFNRAMRLPSRFGGFEPPHLRHEMVIHVCNDSLWYEAARRSPLQHLPKFKEYIGRE